MAVITKLSILQVLSKDGPSTIQQIADKLEEPVTTHLREFMNHLVANGDVAVGARMRPGGILYGLPHPMEGTVQEWQKETAEPPVTNPSQWEYNLYGWAKTTEHAPLTDVENADELGILTLGPEHGVQIKIFARDSEHGDTEVFYAFFLTYSSEFGPLWINGIPALMDFIIKYREIGSINFAQEITNGLIMDINDNLRRDDVKRIANWITEAVR